MLDDIGYESLITMDIEEAFRNLEDYDLLTKVRINGLTFLHLVLSLPQCGHSKVCCSLPN